MSSKNNAHAKTNKAFEENGDDNSSAVAGNNEQQQQNRVYTEKKLEEVYDYNKSKTDNAFKSTINYLVKYYKPNGSCAKNYLVDRFPIIDWLSKYDIKENFVKDLIAGITVKLNNFLSFYFLSTECFYLLKSNHFNFFNRSESFIYHKAWLFL
jgi:hypothetical protein